MTKTKLSQAQVDHIANLSKLVLNPSDQKIGQELSQATNYIQVLNELDVSKTLPTSQVNHKHSIFRTDEVKPSFSQKDALSQAPKSFQGFFVTKATIKK